MELLRPDQQPTAARTLAEASADDPLLHLVQPDPAKRARTALFFFGLPVAHGLRHGRVWANEDASAVAVWIDPESGALSRPRLLRAGLWQMPLKAGLGAMRRFSKAVAVTEPFHKQVEGPHWYLMSVGTRQDRQGQGLGSQLVEMGTSRADSAGVPCYLETATDANIAFYRKRGFEIIGQGDCLGFTLTGMVRKPR